MSVGFGSMNERDPERTTRTVVEALKLSGKRGILLTGWGGLSNADLPDDVFKAEEVPHDWLFPRVAAAVHHGGAGTTATSLRAGLPTVVLPFFAEQAMWGRRVAKLGAGPPPISRKELSAGRLADAIRVAADERTVRDRAAALGDRLRREDGVGNGVRAFLGATTARAS